MNWKTYNKTDFKHLSNNIEVKTNNGKVYSIWNIVGTSVLKKNGEAIDVNDIISWREKKDLEKYKKLQQHYQLLSEYDFEKLDNLEFTISNNLYKDKQKVEKLFKKLRKYIESAEHIIEKESKKYL